MIASLLLEDHYLAKAVGFIGTRDPTPQIMASVRTNAAFVAENSYEFVSGGAKGVDDLAFTTFIACGSESRWVFTAHLSMELYSEDKKLWEHYRDIAKICHSNWSAVEGRGWYVQNLMVRNVIIVDYADIVLAWPHPKRSGGTDHGIAVARYMSKPLEVLSV